MDENKINDFLSKTLKDVSSLIDSSKIIGNPIVLSPYKAIVPISKLTFGIGAASSEFASKNEKNRKKREEYAIEPYPFGGGSLIGVNMIPEAFLIIENEKINIIYMEKEESLFKKILDLYMKIKK